MRDVLRRLEKLEQAAQPEADPLLLIIRFMAAPGRAGAKPQTIAARSSWIGGRHPSEEMERQAGETEEGFIERAERHFWRHEPTARSVAVRPVVAHP
jgi:hypothetical protein